MTSAALPFDALLPTGFILSAVLLGACAAFRKRIAPKTTWNIPDALPAGVLLALVLWQLGSARSAPLPFEALQLGVMQVFFTLIGLLVSVKTLCKASKALLAFYLTCVVLMILQNVLGMSVARCFGIDPRYGILAGSVSMMGGVGTAALFGPYFEWHYAVAGATAIALSAAALGMVVSLIVGPTFAQWLIRRDGLKRERASNESDCEALLGFEAELGASLAFDRGKVRSRLLLVALLGLCLLVGYPLTLWLQKAAAVPAFTGPLLAAAILRNIADISGKPLIDSRSHADAVSVCLVLFIALAIHSVRFDTIAALALPLGLILLMQLALVLLYAWTVVYRFLGRNYESMMLAVGVVGFGLGATANALANMHAVGERHGHLQKALITVSVTGAFLIDFANAIVIAWMGS